MIRRVISSNKMNLLMNKRGHLRFSCGGSASSFSPITPSPTVFVSRSMNERFYSTVTQTELSKLSPFDKLLYLVQQGAESNNVSQLQEALQQLLKTDYEHKQEQLIDAVYYTAIDIGNTDALAYLLENKMKEATIDDVEMAVAGGRRTNVVKFLLDRVLPPDEVRGMISIRGLLTKQYSGTYDMTKFLLETYATNPKQYFHTINPNHQSIETKNTILHLAAMNFRPDTITYLLEEQKIAKILVNQRNVAAFTPLEALIHKVVYKKENPARGELTEEMAAKALECCHILNKHNCLMLDWVILERAGPEFIEPLQAQYQRAKDSWAE